VEKSLKKEQIILAQIETYLTTQSNPQKALFLNNYLRVKYYGLGDQCLGLTVPNLRILSKKVGPLPLTTLRLLINSRIHEKRFLAIINLISQFQVTQKTQQKEQTTILFEFYISEMLNGIDNWDLVDVSADKIVGVYLINKPRLREYYLYKILATSSNL
jgi:3-methyladenine DNA glycosylase AlkD